MSNKFLLTAILVVLPLFSCTDAPPAPPMCRVANNIAQPIGPTFRVACLAKTPNGVVLIGNKHQGQLYLPQRAISHADTPSCNAHQAMWEHTGMNVEVTQLLTEAKDGLAIYHCTFNNGLEHFPQGYALPSWTLSSSNYLYQIDPFTFENKALQNKDDLTPIRDGFVSAK